MASQGDPNPENVPLGEKHLLGNCGGRLVAGIFGTGRELPGPLLGFPAEASKGGHEGYGAGWPLELEQVTM